MMSREQIRYHLTGPVGSVFTPFHQDGSIDPVGVRSEIGRCVDAGSRAIILTAGDSLYTVLTECVRHWSLRSIQVKLIKIGAKVVRHARQVIFQMAEVAVSKELFERFLRRIRALAPASG